MNIRRVRNSTQDCVYELSKYEYDALAEEITRLRAELARIKPSWDDAPDWATALFMGEVFWMNDVQQKAVCPSRREERP